jgi:hypothetical protein
MHRGKRLRPKDIAAACTPGKKLGVAPSSLTLAPNGSDQFTACTQYSSKYTITVSPSGVLTAPTSPSTVTPTEPANGTTYSATVTVTAGATACKNATITIKDKRGNTQTVNVSVTGCSQTFSYTGGSQTFTVPSGVTNITVDAIGASGGPGCAKLTSAGYAAGGSGFEVKATGITVTSGQTLYVYVGGSPVVNSALHCGRFNTNATYTSAGFNGGGASAEVPNLGWAGGGGGGASDVRTGPNQTDWSTRLIVAGGGGGAGGLLTSTTGGDAGHTNGLAGAVSDAAYPLSAGQGGTQDATGGAGGTLAAGSVCCAGNQGSLGIGGSQSWPAGAGGGGYYGGGSSAMFVYANNSLEFSGGGGGGSSFVQSGATVVVQQVATPGQCDANNNGCITISY